MLQVIFGSDNKQKQIYILAFHPDRCEVLSNLTTFSMIIHILESFEEGFMKYYVNNISGGGGNKTFGFIRRNMNISSTPPPPKGKRF
jgi:hypothetical protein